jgi:hypothetical protein
VQLPQVEFLVQAEVGAPFASMGLTLEWQPLGQGFTLPRTADLGQPHRVSAYRFVLRLPYADTSSLRLHSAAFPRMIGKGSLGVKDLITDGPRSPLTASYHFDERLGAQSFGLFPPMVVLDGSKPALLVSPLSENRDRFSISWISSTDYLELTLQFDIWGIGKKSPLMSQIALEGVYLEALTHESFGPRVFSGLHEQLGGEFSDPKSELFWGSWNDGHFRNIDQDRILATADWLKENLPNVKYVQIDDGWAGPSQSVKMPDPEDLETLEMSHLGAFYYPEEVKDEKRFPDGLDGLARKIADKGLKPMIWITPAVLDGSPIVQQHPEWFLEKARLHFFRELRFFDFSIEEARNYWQSTLNLVFKEWGFRGCKLDYWSMGFDQHDVECRNPGSTSMESMHWFLGQLRQAVGEDGLLLYGIDLPFGTPFRAKYFNQFRYYADSEGSCQSVVAMEEQALWAAFLSGLYQIQRYWVPDGDGLGMFDHFEMPDSHYRLWCSFLLGSGTLTELAGWLHKKDESQRLQDLIKTASAAVTGSRVSNPGYDYLAADQCAPSVWVRHDSADQKLLSITNWRSTPLTGEIRAEDLEVDGEAILIDIFTDDSISLPYTYTLEPEFGRAFWVKKKPA